MPLPPQTAIPAALAIVRSRSASPLGAQLAKITAAGMAASAAACSSASSAWLGTASTARSTGPGSSAREGRQGSPSTSG
jgi:hypothetical protein